MHQQGGPAPAEDVRPWTGRQVVFLSWRDVRHPEGGGAEMYLENVARGLAALGAEVTIFCAGHPAAPRRDLVDGVRFVRRGGRFTVYLFGMLALLTGRLGRPDVVVDVHNGLPFWSRLVTRTPVVVLVHHVHREQWPVAVPAAVAGVGWWLESRVAPRVYRGSQYVAVSEATRTELATLGIAPERVHVVRNGSDAPPPVSGGKSATPRLAVVGRLVPHKQVEHAIDAALTLREEFPGLILDVVGAGWWEGVLHEYALTHDAGETVVFHGHATERGKHEIFERAWVLLLPSLKEGWGLVVPEAGTHGTPAVAYRSAGGTAESVRDGETGLLVADQHELTVATRRLLGDAALRHRLGESARIASLEATWEGTTAAFASVLEQAIAGTSVDRGTTTYRRARHSA